MRTRFPRPPGLRTSFSITTPVPVEERGPVVEEQKRFEEGTRLRCLLCDKVAKVDESEAKRAVERIAERVQMYAYFSRRCGWWHLTRTPRRR